MTSEEIRKENKLRHSSFLLFNMCSFSYALSLCLSSFDLPSCRTLFKEIWSGILCEQIDLAKSQTLFVIITSISYVRPSLLLFATFYCFLPLSLWLTLSVLHICVTFYWEFLMNWHRNRSFIKIRWVRCQVLEQQGLPFFSGVLS